MIAQEQRRIWHPVLAKPIRDIAWKAQEGLCRRYRELARAGKPPTVRTAAIARELAIAKQAHPVGAWCAQVNWTVLSALAPDGSTSSREAATHSGGCQNMEGNRRLPHVLPALRRSRNMLAHPGPAAKEVAQFVVASARACR
jgi:hypothetical protein